MPLQYLPGKPGQGHNAPQYFFRPGPAALKLA